MELLHNKKFVGCPDYKTDLLKEFEETFRDFQRDYYKSYVDKNKTAHIRARASLSKLYKLCRPLRRELHEHHIQIPRWEDIVHPSWEGIED